MDNIRVVLASASPRREELLRQIGIIPEVIPSEIEEKVTEKEPDRVVTELSRQKAEEVAARLGETDAQTTIVVGSDTVVYANGEILENRRMKPMRPECSGCFRETAITCIQE